MEKQRHDNEEAFDLPCSPDSLYIQYGMTVYQIGVTIINQLDLSRDEEALISFQKAHDIFQAYLPAEDIMQIKAKSNIQHTVQTT